MCSINWLVFITEFECVYCAVRTESLNAVQVNLSVQSSVCPCQYHSINAPYSFVYMLLFPHGQTGQDWEPSESNALSEIGKSWIGKCLHLLFEGLSKKSELRVRISVKIICNPNQRVMRLKQYWSKVKFTLEQATKAQRGGKGTPLLFL